jgi:type II secretory pathway pseudopilin PulG
MLVVIGIIAVLLGLLIPAVWLAVKRKNETATHALITDLNAALVNYRSHEGGTFPLQPGSSTKLYDDGTGTYAPKYYQSPCAALNAPASGSETNKDLIALLRGTGKFNALMSRIVNGELLDYFGRPLVVRFLVVQHGSGADATREERVFIWSYGANGKNEVKAQSVYVNTGLPDYDNAEAANIEGSPGSDSDDLTSWR